MKRSHSILSDGHIFNSPRIIDPVNAGALKLKPKVKHSLILNSSGCSDPRNICDSAGSVSIVPNVPTKQPCMKKVTNNPGASSNPAPVPLTYFASPIRTLKESLKDPGTHNISIHDLVEAYNGLSTKLRDRIDNVKVTPSIFTIIKDESELLSDCLVRDIGRVLPNPFASQHYNDSLGNISFYSEEVSNDGEIQIMTDNNLLCQYALRFVSDIFTFPSVHCNFTDNQLVLLFDYVLRICKTPNSAIFNIEKHAAMVVWILKVQQLPLSILSPLKKEIMLTLENSISHDLGRYVAKLDAFKAVRSILRKYPSCSSWLIGLLPTILKHINSDSPEIAIHAAMACSGFTTAKMEVSHTDAFPSELASKHVENYVIEKMSRRTLSGNAAVLFDFFKSAAHNKSQWQHLGLSFALTVVSCFIVLLEHRIFLKSECIRFVVLVLRECAGSLPSMQKEAWGLLFWAYSRLPQDLERNVQRNRECTKERAFRVVRQDGRQSNLVALLLRAGELKVEAKRTDEDISRALILLLALVGSDSPEERQEGTTILARMMASIGSPLTTYSQVNELPFPRELIDNSILLQTPSKIKVSPFRIPMEWLPPLTETEVLCHWDRLVEVWISIAQYALDSGQDLTAEVVQTWQALLLVRGEIMPGEEDLTGPPGLSSQIASIMNGFTSSVDSPEMQIGYLSFIRKLWSVMKNVFAESFLSSPGESILASLLKRSFNLVDDHVKDLWSQLCGDLISVGVPTLLRAVHRRDSESQEEHEVTHQLWTVLAKNGLLENEVQSWETLVDFLAMPIGVWDPSTTELQYWQSILARAIEIGAQTSRTQEDVINRFLSFCAEPKMIHLKQSPRILRSLLVQLSKSSDPCSPTNLKILSWIDDSLCDSYYSLEDRDGPIGTLRLISEVISNTAESDIVRLLCTLQKSLFLWIGDADRKLQGNEDDEMVDALYKRSLDILSHVEPSIAILEMLTDFFMSVFVRLRGRGPLAFYDFWQATYHKRDSIPKNQIPISIRQKLKSWADVTHGSIGDGISFDSGSESIRSFIIPDSQPGGFEDVDLINQEYPLDEKTGLMIATHREYSQQSDEDYEIMPVARSRLTEPGGVSGVLDIPDCSRTSFDDHPHSQRKTTRSPWPVASTAKRSADSDASGSHTPKRRKTDGLPRLDIKPRGGKGKEKAKDISRLPSPSLRSFSHAPLHDKEQSMRRASEDYDSWERNVTLEEVKQVRAQFQQGSSVDQYDDHQSEDEVETGMADIFESDDHDFLSPSLGQYPVRSRARERSQTAPEQSNPTLPAPNSLRRNNTTPAEGTDRKTLKFRDQVDVLQKAYAVVAYAGPSQVDVDDLMKAKRVLNELNEALDEQISSKLGPAGGHGV